MNKIDSIALRSVLPRVFRGAEKDEPVVSSEVWMHDLVLRRQASYMVEAESGTGKSSLCAFVYGNRRDYGGTIMFNDRDIRTFSIDEWCEVRRRHLAYLPQNMMLFPELTAFDNINIKNRLTDRLSGAEIRSLLDRLEIGVKADVPAAQLSIGQQQRVAIIRALAQPFDFLLLDEPVSHLDSRNNLTVAQLIVETAHANDAAIVTTSVGNPLLLARVGNAETIKSIKL